MPCDCYIERLRFRGRVDETLANLYLFMAHLGFAPARRRQVVVRMILVKLFKVNILHIGPEIGRAPGDPIVVAENYSRRAGERYARNMQTWRDKLGPIP